MASATPNIYEIENWWPCKKFQEGTNTLEGLFKAISMFQMLYGCHYLIEKVRFLFMRNRAVAIIQVIATWVGVCWQCLLHSERKRTLSFNVKCLSLGEHFANFVVGENEPNHLRGICQSFAKFDSFHYSPEAFSNINFSSNVLTM